MKYQTILLKYVFGLKGAAFYEAITTVIFSHVKISSFRAKAHVVFHCYSSLHNKNTVSSLNIKRRANDHQRERVTDDDHQRERII